MYVDSKRKWCKWTYFQKRKRLKGQTYGCLYTLLYFKWITNKDILDSTGNSAEGYVAAWVGGVWGENGYMCVYTHTHTHTHTHTYIYILAVLLKRSHFNQLYPNTKLKLKMCMFFFFKDTPSFNWCSYFILRERSITPYFLRVSCTYWFSSNVHCVEQRKRVTFQ